MHCAGSYKPLKHKKSKDQKDFKAKKNDYLAAINNSKNSSQSGQVLGWSSKKDFLLYRENQQDQSSNTPATSSNTTIIKKEKK